MTPKQKPMKVIDMQQAHKMERIITAKMKNLERTQPHMTEEQRLELATKLYEQGF